MIRDKILDLLISKEGHMIQGIVFLPYCYAMWDCMKSVFEGCLERGIPCAVMPIPYFSLKDGKIDEWHYEFDAFEGEIDEEDLLDFNKFDELDFSHVVIHNPYDDRNTLTTIHPFFYSDVLKEKGKKIIFIPYGIPYGGVSCDEMRLQKGALNADYIFVNGEKELAGMINAFKKIGVDISDRCFATGSPKLDALTDNREMPFDWKSKICKRVTLVCNSLIAFMNNPQKKLEQYKEVVWNQLANGRMVIFRPHPLMNETIRTRLPQYYDEWYELLDWIAQDCIIDDYYALATDIQFSDQLISDPSSVVEIWKETGKPYEVLE